MSRSPVRFLAASSLAFLLWVPLAWAENLRSLNPDATVAELTSALNDPDIDIRIWAAQTLGSHGASAQPAVSSLMKSLRNPNLRLRVTAAIALLKIDPVMRDVIPFLINALERESSMVSSQQVERFLRDEGGAFGVSDFQEELIQKWEGLRRGELTAEMIPMLLLAMKDSDGDVRTLAVILLSGIGAKSQEAVHALVQALRDSNPDVQTSAIIALERIGLGAAEAVPELNRLLSSPKGDIRLRAAAALLRVDPQGKQAVPALIHLLKDRSEEEGHRVAAAHALGVAIAAPEQTVPAFIAVLDDPNTAVQAAAVGALDRIGPAAVPLLLSALRNPDAGMRGGVVQVLGSVGKGRPEVVSALIGVMVDKDRGVRYLTAQALGKAGSSTPEAISALVAALSDVESAVRLSAGDALVRIGPTAVPALLAASNAEDPGLRARAALILERIRSGGARG